MVFVIDAFVRLCGRAHCWKSIDLFLATSHDTRSLGVWASVFLLHVDFMDGIDILVSKLTHVLGLKCAEQCTGTKTVQLTLGPDLL